MSAARAKPLPMHSFWQIRGPDIRVAVPGTFCAFKRIGKGSCSRATWGHLMATECIAYRDSKGGLHSTPQKATLADVLGRVGEEGGMTSGVAKRLLDKRADIERVFAQHDKMTRAGDAAHAEDGVTPIKQAG